MFINKNIDRFMIESGTPLVHMVPVTDKNVVLKHHLVSQQEFSKVGIPDEYDMIRPERYTRWIKENNENNPKPKNNNAIENPINHAWLGAASAGLQISSVIME
jgi:hypothetical protein